VTVRLGNLADQATKGTWEIVDEDGRPLVRGKDEVFYGAPDQWDDARLIALAPDMARLLSDMADAANDQIRPCYACDLDDPGEVCTCSDPPPDWAALLARFRQLEERA
jgi:hypothetical protein